MSASDLRLMEWKLKRISQQLKELQKIVAGVPVLSHSKDSSIPTTTAGSSKGFEWDYEFKDEFWKESQHDEVFIESGRVDLIKVQRHLRETEDQTPFTEFAIKAIGKALPNLRAYEKKIETKNKDRT